MGKDLIPDDKQHVKRPEPEEKSANRQPASGEAASLLHLQQQIGNRAVQRLVAQRSGDGAFDLDDETAGRINQARSGGQTLDGTVQKQMGQALGHDFSGVRVHTSPTAHQLNEQLNAKAFTTGQDIFFKEGAYDPHSGGGQELLAHELTHVVQQSSGAVDSGGSRMTVNPPGDAFEQEADAVARQVTSLGNVSAGSEGVQRQEIPEEEEDVQMKGVQRQEIPEEEEDLQMKAVQRQEGIDEEEEALQMKGVQRQELSEEEEMMG